MLTYSILTRWHSLHTADKLWDAAELINVRKYPGFDSVSSVWSCPNPNPIVSRPVADTDNWLGTALNGGIYWCPQYFYKEPLFSECVRLDNF